MAQTPTQTAEHAATIRSLLANHRVLGRLDHPALDEMVRLSHIQDVGERSRIFDQGEAGNTVMAVISGYVKLAATTAAGREVLLDVAGPGDVFGEVAVLNNWPRAAEAEALSACRLLVIDGNRFVQTLQRQSSAMLAVVRLLSDRLRVVNEQLTDSVDLPAPARLAKALFRLAALHSHAVPGGLRIDLILSQRELGAMTGLTRESINKHLASWRDAGWLHLSDGAIVLARTDALRGLLREYGWE